MHIERDIVPIVEGPEEDEYSIISLGENKIEEKNDK
jgi:hypothetical protein